MNIVFVTTGLGTGGAEMMLFNLLERLDRRFFCRVISLTSLGEVGAQIQALGIPVEALHMSPGVLPLPSAFIRLVRRLKEVKPDVVHTWMYHADLLGGLAGKLAGQPAVAWGIHNGNLDRGRTKPLTRRVAHLSALLSRWLPDRILSCSEKTRQVHVAFGYSAEKMKVIPNGFDLLKFKPDEVCRAQVRSELGVAPDTPLVGLIGRFDPQKNHAGFFEAVHLLHLRLPSVQFVLAGKNIDYENKELMLAMEKIQLNDIIHLLGMRSDIPRIMAALDVLVSSSYGEAFPNVLGEAMACGTPCVVTDVGDSAYIVGDSGRVVAPGDMHALSEAVAYLLILPEDQRRALGERARVRVTEKFELGKIVKQYEIFYEELSALRKNRQVP